jgi:hypothetical protein
LFYRDKLVSNPYAPLTQEYQTCSPNPETEFVNQIGVSVGNVSVLSPVGVLLVLALLALYQYCSGAVVPKAYGRNEKDAALDALAEALLLVRDKRVDLTAEIKRYRAQKEVVSKNGGWYVGSQSVTSNDSQGKLKDASTRQLQEKQLLLTTLVEQLSAVSTTAAALKYHETDAPNSQLSHQEPLAVNWSNLYRSWCAPLFGSTQRKPMRNVHSGAVTGGGWVGAGVEESGEVPGDSNALELSTISQLHRGGAGGGGGGGEA